MTNVRLVIRILLIATAATGPIGAIGCAAMALSLWSRHPSPSRLQQWYDYISGVVARPRVAHLYDELVAGRLPSDPVAKVPRFTPILQGASVEDQQRVLGVIGRRYHADFRPVLRRALRNRNGFIRAQAAAVASRLNRRREEPAVVRRTVARSTPHPAATRLIRTPALVGPERMR